MIEFDLCKWDKATRRKLFLPRDWALSVSSFEFVYCEVKTTTFVNESGEVEQLIFCQNQFKEKPMRNLESISRPTDSNSCSSKNTSFPKEGHWKPASTPL